MGGGGSQQSSGGVGTIGGMAQSNNLTAALSQVKSGVQGTTIQPGSGGVYGGMYCAPGWTMGAPPPAASPETATKTTSVTVQCYQQTTPTSNVAAPATGTSSYVSFGSPYLSVSTGQPTWAYVVAISAIVIALILAKKSK